ncbi:MAG: hypothetical protein HQL05_12825 [Nitrospirae bacterium]|uniref:hypothetical protein n=1 Tax=Candidatus Magnetobacterium casense TaxID=1455061 RepID=UPI00058C6F06|nr:hypothetical protein [Candidatus Magnetobacterium casensis]MBF0338699.1 hypothetical protein [Nitrospirota bacterium]
MKIKPDSWTIVIVGSWNLATFTPEWLVENIFYDTDIQVEVALGYGMPFRFKSPGGGFTIIPEQNRITLMALKDDDLSLLKMEKAAYKLLELLSYTPVTAIGFNFGFEDISLSQLPFKYDFEDSMFFNALGYLLTSQTINRRFIVDNSILNLSVTIKQDTVWVDFNFHYDLNNAADYKTKVTRGIVDSKQIVTDLLRDGYKLNTDSINDDNDNQQ